MARTTVNYLNIRLDGLSHGASLNPTAFETTTDFANAVAAVAKNLIIQHYEDKEDN